MNGPQGPRSEQAVRFDRRWYCPGKSHEARTSGLPHPRGRVGGVRHIV